MEETKVLIVDDDRSSSVAARKLVERTGMKVVVSSNTVLFRCGHRNLGFPSNYVLKTLDQCHGKRSKKGKARKDWHR